jgi:hypothetical protein
VARRSLVVPVLSLLFAAAPAGAAEFTVDATDDAVDAALDGVCADALGRCTLRAAVQEANDTLAEEDTIHLPAGTYLLSLIGPGEDLAATGDLDVTAPLTLDGAGAETTIIRGKKDRVLDVLAAEVLVTDVTITKGKLGKKGDMGDDFNGGGIRNAGILELQNVVVTRNKASDDGGGIANFDPGMLTLENVTVSRNKSGDDAGGLDIDGGMVELVGVTLSGNKAKDEGGGMEGEGGALVEATNVTLSGNKAALGGGANFEQGAEVLFVNVTLTRNKAKGEGGGLNNQFDPAETPAEVSISNTLVAGNKKVDCFGTILSQGGGNVEGGTSCGLSGAGDKQGAGTTGLEKKLAENGGPTATHALVAGSPAIDFAVDDSCPPADQRGLGRFDDPTVKGTLCDSGAFELQGP